MREVGEASGFNRESDSVTVGAQLVGKAVAHPVCFNRESDSVTVGAKDLSMGDIDDSVSIAKAIPSLLEPSTAMCSSCAFHGFNRESDSVTVGAPAARMNTSAISSLFQSRKRFRHCWSHIDMLLPCWSLMFQSRKRFRHCWSRHWPGDSVSGVTVSIAKAIPSLLERDA